MATNKKHPDTWTIVEKTRLFYAAVDYPKSYNGGPEKYSGCFAFKKDDKKNLARLNKVINAAKEAGKTKLWGGKIPAKLTMPLHDGDVDRADDENFADCFYFNARSDEEPQKVGIKKSDVIEPGDIYSGCYVNVSVTAFPFSNNGNKGVGLSLGNLQKVSDGARLAGRSTAEEDFDFDEEDEGEDEDILGDEDIPDYLR